MSTDTKRKIIEETKKIIALESFDGFNVRKLADATELSPSHLYYYTKNTQALFKDTFLAVAKEIGQKRAQLPMLPTATKSLRQRIEFQLDNAEDVVYILKYYTTFRTEFEKLDSGYVPHTAYKHILEVLDQAEQLCEWKIDDKIKTAKVITHAINGFVLEYYPHIPTGREKEQLIDDIHSFLVKALQ